MRLAGRVVAITGGSGLGADACRLARARGARAIQVDIWVHNAGIGATTSE